LRIVLLGKPGSGKGTQATMLSGETGLPHLSSGAILREEIRERTPFGARIEEYVLRGEIGPQELITEVVFSYIDRKGCGEGFILDGFPRTLFQAESLDRRYLPDRCVLIDVPDGIIVERISGRLTCSGCGAVYNASDRPTASPGVCDLCGKRVEKRRDDDEETIRARLRTYRADVHPVIEMYSAQGRLTVIDGGAPPPQVYESFRKAVKGG
jgi:adenylate kinase